MRQFEKALILGTLTLLFIGAPASATFTVQCHNKPKSGSGGLSEGGSGGINYVKGMPEGGNETRPESLPANMNKPTFADYKANLPAGAKAPAKAFQRLEKFMAKFSDAVCKAADKGGVTCTSAASGHSHNFKKLDPEILNKLFKDKIVTASEAKGSTVDGYIASNMGYVSFSKPDGTAFAEPARSPSSDTYSLGISTQGESADSNSMIGAR